MGMFDEIRCKRVMPDGYQTDELYQSKDWNCMLEQFEITDDGLLIELQDSEKGVQSVLCKFTGTLHFYKLDAEGKMHRYNGQFADGRLVEITTA